MTLPKEALPSKGRGLNVDFITLNPLTMKQILNFQDEFDVKNLSFNSRLLILIKHIIPEEIKALPLCDLFAIIAYRLYISSTDSFRKDFQITFECPKCFKATTSKIGLRNIEFNDFDPAFYKLESIEISGKRFFVSMPTIKSFEDILVRYKFVPVSERGIRVFMIMAMLVNNNDIDLFKEAIESSTVEDIALINYLYEKICCPIKRAAIKCSGCKEVTAGVELIDKLADLFRNIPKNCGFNKDKISFVS